MVFRGLVVLFICWFLVLCLWVFVWVLFLLFMLNINVVFFLFIGDLKCLVVFEFIEVLLICFVSFLFLFLDLLMMFVLLVLCGILGWIWGFELVELLLDSWVFWSCWVRVDIFIVFLFSFDVMVLVRFEFWSGFFIWLNVEVCLKDWFVFGWLLFFFCFFYNGF